MAALREQRFAPIELSRQEVEAYYNQFSNGGLWPTLHYLIDRLPAEMGDWQGYPEINNRFADEVARHWRPGDLVWVHDFHLMLLPKLLRERLGDAQIGFFLHVPFPSSEVFRVLPWRAELLRGLLGADLIGFHTLGYLRHFSSALLRTLGMDVRIDRVDHGDRTTRLVAMPMGIDVETFDRLAVDADVRREVAALRRQSGRAKIMLGVDRLDYTKGLPRRLMAFERLLEMRGPDASPVQLVQVAVSSRNDVSEYKRHKRGVDELVGRINGRFGSPDFTPIRYVNSSLDLPAVTTLYRAADVMLVTPVRDGLNLVAKEFVAARSDEDGVLLLSEFAGAATEMPEALKVHPYDVNGTVDVMATALAMPREERRRRMRALRDSVTKSNVHNWVRTFLDELRRTGETSAVPVGDGEKLREALATARQRGPLTLFVDYDGTLVDFAARPELAVPAPALLATLRMLAASTDLDVHVVSGRPRAFLEKWFGSLPVGLHGEHGLVSRSPGGVTWTSTTLDNTEWRERVQRLMKRFSAQAPGSIVETKALSVAFHYRQVAPETARLIVEEIRLHLADMLSQSNAVVLAGKQVLEVRPIGIHKGNIVKRVMGERSLASTAVVLGDDVTDEDMFATAGPDAITIKVGSGRTDARYRVEDCREARRLLETLLAPADLRPATPLSP